MDHPKEIAKFIFYTRMLNWKMLRIYLDERFVCFFKCTLLMSFTNVYDVQF